MKLSFSFFIRTVLFVFGLFSFYSFYGQRIENENPVRKIHSDHYWRLFYDNDFIAWTDYYYTQGLNLELVKPSFQKNPLDVLLFSPRNSKTKYGIAIDHWGFTPEHISADSISYGDRPYCGILSVNSFRIAIHEERKEQITSSIIIGLMGPVAGGKPLQTALHRWIDDPIPKGWEYQLGTDMILNYKIDCEKNLLSSKFFLLNANAEVRAGTLHDRISGGFNLMAGKINDPFQEGNTSIWQAYLYGSSSAGFVAFDATMQGGVFNKNNPYTLSASEIKRATLQSRIGLMLNYKKIYLELAETFLSKEFKNGLRHRWGSISIGFALK